MGARPIAYMDGIIVEEGFPRNDLDRIFESMIKLLREKQCCINRWIFQGNAEE
ncbi:hypothetical protein [Staphylothermus hellenicus]|uniref:hypothetical protein n=1 Tax=Staphylothermus hellenicus TaxID=84599 RepID=UPI0001C43CFD|nr:hypothetical protein [Staphylothermus hellenicus]